MGDPPYVTSKPVRQDLRGSPWSAGQANSAERWLWKTVFRRLSTCLSTGILNIIVYHIICGKSTPIVENFMNSTKFPRGNLRKLWRAKTDKKRAFSTGGAAWKVDRRSLCGIAIYLYYIPLCGITLILFPQIIVLFYFFGGTSPWKNSIFLKNADTTPQDFQ